MSPPVVFRKAAQAEFDDAIDWYEKQRPGLGADFAARVRATLIQNADRPEAHAMNVHGVRGAIVPGFPYRIITRQNLLESSSSRCSTGAEIPGSGGRVSERRTRLP